MIKIEIGKIDVLCIVCSDTSAEDEGEGWGAVKPA